MTNPLPTVPVHAIDPQPDAPQWLVRDLWTTAASRGYRRQPQGWQVVVWPRSRRLGRVRHSRPRALPGRRHRTGSGVSRRGRSAPRPRPCLPLVPPPRPLVGARLDLQVVTADRFPVASILQVVTADRLRLDTERDQLALDQTVQRIRPALLLLDPLVRLHSLDENSASDISSLLAFLRAINRRYHLALILVHHMAKRSRRNLGQSLRGSSDLHAWTDSACYLVRRPDDRLQLTVEHRSAPAPDPLLLRLSGGGDQPLSLLVDSADAPPPPLPEAVRAALRSAGQPLSRTVLRQRLRVNNARLGVALLSLQQRGLAVRSPNGWHLPS